jgi:hypothetical protein
VVGQSLRVGAVVSHISRKTSEIWGTRSFVSGTDQGPRVVVGPE